MTDNQVIDTESKELWDRAVRICIGTLPSDEEKGTANRNFSMISAVSGDGVKFTVTTASAFAAKLLKQDYHAKLLTALSLAGAKGDISIEFQADETLRPALIVPSVNSTGDTNKGVTAKSDKVIMSTIPLNPDFTFEEFVRGPSNALANATAVSIANKPGNKGYNPFFIYGGTGLGKTHLMQAIGNELLSKNPKMSVCYITAEVFLNEFVNALENHTTQQFRDRYRSVDVLLVDDIQFIAKRDHFQEEFFNTFCTLTGLKNQIVLTSDVPPQKLQNFDARLISRFEGGMVQEIEQPSYETRLAILRRKSDSIVPKIPDNALKFIADNINSHVRAMEGALAKINLMMKENPTLAVDDEVLKVLLRNFIEKERNLRKITIEEIQNLICKKYSITMAQILSSERTQSLVTPRQLAMYISRKYTTKSLTEIAKMFDKTHATILNGVKAIKKRMDVEPELHESMLEIISKFGLKDEDKVD